MQLSTDSTFATTVINDSNLTSTSRTVTGLLNNKIYYWRVNAKNAAGTSSYSVIWHFTTVALAAPPSPILTTPVQNASAVPVSTNLTWSSSNGATSYRVQLSTDSTFATTVINDSTLTGTSRAVTGLLNNKIYYWRVNAKNAAGTSGYSAIWNFTVSTVTILPNVYILQSLNLENENLIHFSLPRRTKVAIQLFNSQGRRISQLLNEYRDAGSYVLPLTNIPQGAYYLDFRAGDFHKTLTVQP